MPPGQPGDLLASRYRLQEVIGRGGMGVVWLASDELLRRDVAIKEAIPPAGLDEDEWRIARERSLHEAQAAAKLNHPNIASVYDVLWHDDCPWIVMQLVPYPSLRDVLRKNGPMSPADAAHIGLCVLAAMRAAWAAGVLHRDIKPGNILLGPEGDVVLTDFGLAIADTAAHLTLTGNVVGSPAYMSPERARGEGATLASDLWSLGATLYAATEGRDPFERSATMAVLIAVVNDDPDPPERCGPLWPVISALLRKDPRARLGPEDTERRLRWAAGVTGEPEVTGPAIAVAAGPAPFDETPDGNTGQRSSRRVTAAWLASVLASIVMIAAIMITASLARSRGADNPANSPRAGSSPATQSHTSRPSVQSDHRGPRKPAGPKPAPAKAAGPGQSARAKPPPPPDHVPPGQAKHGHGGGKPKKKPKGKQNASA
jgi:eukaryotic-like serine/threonine-protein kinase